MTRKCKWCGKEFQAEIPGIFIRVEELECAVWR